jgi:valyl-tRNA synthetase
MSLLYGRLVVSLCVPMFVLFSKSDTLPFWNDILFHIDRLDFLFATEFLPVATTRPETICGDTAVCVHPEDDRYRHLVGKKVVVPRSGGRTIPVIADEYVDMEFGTGALKITPGHDPNDYELGKKFNLPIINIMNKDGSMNANSGEYVGLDRFECREKLWADMESDGLVIKVNPHSQRVPRSQRGGEIIEPLVSSQWFVKTEGMGAKALKAVQDGDIQIVPQRFNKIWYNWLTDIHDWCVSRQLWWGHRIPVWYVGESGQDEYIVARNEQEARKQAVDKGHAEDVVLRQEEDVLDTWFSSGLWPFATVGWPQDEGKKDSDLARFYPGSCLETGYDILFFWVARMVMMGIELTGKSPFEVVYLHGLVRAADGTKMSKTKGNVIDPLDTVAEFGADSLRYSLVTGVTPGQDIPLNMEKIEANKNFANKLWNCCKFVAGNALKNIDDAEMAQLGVAGPITQEEFDSLSLPEQYIVSKCHSLVASVTADIENYQLGAAGSKVYEFLWDQYADWYIEISKTRLYEGAGGGDEAEAKAARRVLVYILDTSLRLLHPYMPYITEQLWHHLPRPAHDERKAANSIMLADWPQMDDGSPLITSEAAVNQFECFQALTRKVRNARAEYNVEPGKRISAVVVAHGDILELLRKEGKSLVALAKLDPDQLSFFEAGSDEANAAIAEECVQVVVQDGVEAYLPLSGLIDPDKERKRLEKQNERLVIEIQKRSATLQSKGFVDKAPPAVVDKAKRELAELEDQAAKIQSSLAALS